MTVENRLPKEYNFVCFEAGVVEEIRCMGLSQSFHDISLHLCLVKFSSDLCLVLQGRVIVATFISQQKSNDRRRIAFGLRCFRSNDKGFIEVEQT